MKNNLSLNIVDTAFTKENLQNILEGSFNAPYIKLFGIIHFSYKDCLEYDLIKINPKVAVHRKCALAFEKMRIAAQNDNINLEIISGYRSSDYQVSIFKKKFTVKDSPTLSELEMRLKFSAPPGFSEHHTGLAIDINSVEDDFAMTKEYEWLKNNAHKFGFENSFPQSNRQGLGFEPWHWRFIDNETQALFLYAKSL